MELFLLHLWHILQHINIFNTCVLMLLFFFCVVFFLCFFFFFLYVSEYGYLALRTEMKHTRKSAYVQRTFKNLHTQWETFLMFCDYFKLDSLPATSETLRLYAQFLHRSFQTVQSIKNCISADLAQNLNIEFPTADMMHLNLLLRGVSRTKQHIGSIVF